jgi:hypothetical protein
MNKLYEGQRAIEYCISINAPRLFINLFVAFPSKMNSTAANKTAISAIYEDYRQKLDNSYLANLLVLALDPLTYTMHIFLRKVSIYREQPKSCP